MSASKTYKGNETAAETAAKAKDPMVIVHPDHHPATNMGLMRQSMQEMKRLTRPANTQEAYDPKALEYRQFCDFRYPTEEAASRYILTTEKVYAFMWYQSLRETKKGKKQEKGLMGLWCTSMQWNMKQLWPVQRCCRVTGIRCTSQKWEWEFEQCVNTRLR